MKAIDINTTLVEGYLRMLENLSLDNKLDLISKLSLSVKADMGDKKKSFFKAFGAWDSEQTAEEIISEIISSRTFDRKIELF